VSIPASSLAPDICLVVVLGASAITDLRTGRIFNTITYPAIALGLVAPILGFGPGPSSAAIGCLVGGGALYLLFACGWMGGGDVKLMAAVGALRGYPFILHAMFYSVFVGGVAAALMLIWRGHTREVIGDLAVVVRRLTGFGDASAPIPARGGALPFGVAIGVGTLAALILEWRS